jgi:hypothetical protein
MLVRIITGLAFFSILGCKTITSRGNLDDTEVAAIRKIAVYSLLGNDMNQTYIGTTVFENKDQTIDVTSWNLDALVTSTLRKDLRTNTAFTKVEVLKGPMDRSQIMAKDGRKIMLDQAKAQGFDTLIVLWPNAYANAPGVKAGFGLHRRNALGIKHTFLYILAGLNVYNVSTGELIAWQFLDELGNSPELPGLKDPPWKDDPSTYTKEELASMQKTLKEHIVPGLQVTLKSLNLIQ